MRNCAIFCGSKSDLMRFAPRPCTTTTARSADGTGNHQPLRSSPSVLLKDTSSWTAATLSAGGSSGCRVGFVRPSATLYDTPAYARSPSTNAAAPIAAQIRRFLTPGPNCTPSAPNDHLPFPVRLHEEVAPH